MLFHAPIFLTAFLPAVLLLAWISGRRGRNLVLLVMSLFFYAWGEGRMVFVLIASGVLHWALGLWIERARNRASLAVFLGVAFDLGLLFLFKYAGWILGEVPALALVLRPTGASGPPIGVSFFTFQALSYLVDVQRRAVQAQRNPLSFLLYLALFPQLIAGPIVRYATVADQIDHRRVRMDRVADGLRRFITGLGKKVLLAGSLAPVTEQIFALGPDQLGPGAAWVGLLAYSLQIYLDFSGYSDMAIGIGRALGFEFLENFLHPYSARSITEFWRRWHVSLSTWFRDYLYIPLGGSRRGRLRTALNLVVVFLLCGIWHGAAWTFVVWGAWHGVLLVFERAGGGRLLLRLPRPAQHIYTVLLACLAWVPFNCSSLGAAVDYWRALFGLGADGVAWPALRFLSNTVIVALLLSVIACVPWFPWLRARILQASARCQGASLWAVSVALLLVLVLSLSESIQGTSTPFIYFRF